MKIKVVFLAVLMLAFNDAFSLYVSLTRSVCSKGPNGYEFVDWKSNNVVDEDGKIYRINQFINCYQPGGNNCPETYPGRPIGPGTTDEISDIALPAINNAIESMIVKASKEIENNAVMTGMQSSHIMVSGDQDYLITFKWSAHYDQNNCLIEGFVVEVVPYP